MNAEHLIAVLKASAGLRNVFTDFMIAECACQQVNGDGTLCNKCKQYDGCIMLQASRLLYEAIFAIDKIIENEKESQNGKEIEK